MLRWLVALGLIGAAALEIGLRTMGLGSPPLYRKDERIGYVMAPNQEVRRLGRRIAINHFHQRSDPLELHPEADVLRLFVIGDSISFGVAQVDQSGIYPELLAARLRHGGRKVEVANAAAPSWAIGNLRAYVEHFGCFNSKMTIVQIGSSDLLQPTSRSDGVGVNPSQPDRKPLTAMGELLVRYVVPRVAPTLVPGVEARDEPVGEPEREEQFQRNIAHFLVLVAQLRARGCEPMVLAVPGLAELDGYGGKPFTRYAPYRARFRSLLADLDVPALDLAETWSGNPFVSRYYTDGTHFTAEGNHAIADALFAYIQPIIGRTGMEIVATTPGYNIRE